MKKMKKLVPVLLLATLLAGCVAPAAPAAAATPPTTMAETLPEPTETTVRETEAPAPANSIKGSYHPKKPITAPRHTKSTMILPGIIFVFSIKICTSAQIRPPTQKALKYSITTSVIVTVYCLWNIAYPYFAILCFFSGS